MNVVHIDYVNTATIRIRAEPGILQELRDIFTFEAPNAKYHPLVRKGKWDGMLKLIDGDGNMSSGLLGRLIKTCQILGYECAEKVEPRSPMDMETLKAWVAQLGIPEDRQPRPYQYDAILTAIHQNRTLISPTSSGKSLIIFILCRYFACNTLLIVPRIGLIKQMIGDFKSYGAPKGFIGTLKKPGRVTVTTWQSIYEKPKEFFKPYQAVIGDEAHLFTAKSLVTIMNNLTECPNRIGLTGTLDDSNVHELVLEGLFGPKYQVTHTHELMEQGYVAQLKINMIVLKHPEHACLALVKDVIAAKKKAAAQKKPEGAAAYQAEIERIVACGARTTFIAKAASFLDGNILLMFHREEHGLEMVEQLKALNTGRNVYFINGKISATIREEIRQIVETEDDALLVASTGTTGTGINITRLNYGFMGHPWKGKIVNLQGIGRGLRLSNGKDGFTMFDVVDDYSVGDFRNYGTKHGMIRAGIYKKEKFDYDFTVVKLNY